MIKKLWALSVCALLVCGLFLMAGCSSQGEKAKEPSGQQQQKSFSLATGGTGGAYYIVGSGISSLVEKYVPNTKLVVQATAASVENVRLVGTKKVDFAITMPDSAYFATKAEREFAKEQPYTSLRAVGAGHVSPLQPFVLEKSGIKTISDLKGKKVALSAPASPAVYAAKAVLEAYGLKESDYKPVLLSYAEQVEAIKDGAIDAGFVFAGAPTSALMDLSATAPMRLLQTDESKINEIVKNNPYYTKAKIKAGTYKGQDQDVMALGVVSFLLTREDVDQQVVYDITKAVFDHTKELTEIHPVGSEWDIENAAEGMGIQLHPGAEKFYKEKGIIK